MSSPVTSPVTVERLDGGAIWRVTFGGSKGNILDMALMSSLARVFREAGGTPDVRAICLEGQGGHFSFGASVQEHLPEKVAGMLERFDDLVLAILESHIPVVTAVRGQCLGGGLELAILSHRIVASQDAMFGQPEIVLGVFAPVASILLAERAGRGRAEDLCLSGRRITAGEAFRMGLVDEVTQANPSAVALAYVREHLAPRSASSLRLAVEAIRMDLVTRLRAELPGVERLYLTRLMTTDDAVEGLQAFLEKRPPAWRHR
jgi:cyclohexa-1,5-dienecarbonyl-CoA hydratase